MANRWTIASNPLTRQLLADDIFVMMPMLGNRMATITSIFLRTVGTDDLNEVNAIEFLRLSSDGAGGIMLTGFEKLEIGSALNGGFDTSFQLDNDGWSTPPTVAAVLGGARPFNLSHGFRWPRHSGETISVRPTERFGFRIVDTVSASMTWQFQIDYDWIGG